MTLFNRRAPLDLLIRQQGPICQPANGRLSLRVAIRLLALTGIAVLILGPLTASAQADGPQAVPDVPNKPTATAVYEGMVDLEWNEVPGATSYDVQAFYSDWFDLPGNGVELAFYGPGAIIKGLIPGSRYYFRVRANNSLGSSEWSEHLFVNPTGGDFGNWDDVPEPTNSRATGAPASSGTAQVGKTLTADISGIEDENGLDRVKFHYQWVSIDGTDEEDIKGGTDASYVLVADDEGRFIKVRVSFTDRGGYAESVPSAATTEVEPPPKPPSPPLNLVVTNNENGELALSWEAPASDGGSAVMGYKVRWKSENEEYGPSREASVSVLSYTVRELTNGVEHSVQVVAVNEVGDGEAAEITATPRDTIPPELLTVRVNGPTITLNYDEALDTNSTPPTSAFSVLVGGTAREVSEVSISGSSVSFTLASAVTPDDTVALSYSAPQDTGEQRVQDTTGNNAPSFSEEPVANDTPTPNTRPTGLPAISGTAQVGETLDADTSAIVDADGLTSPAFTYQWVRNDGTTDTDIAGATSSSYILTEDDEGKAIMVIVSFTDDRGHVESLTSEVTGVVANETSTPDSTGVICGRTEQVRDEILRTVLQANSDNIIWELPADSDCASVSESDLLTITWLGLSYEDITELQSGDFQGLSNLAYLGLSDNDLTELPAGVFSGLSNLETLNLSKNELSELPAEVFSGLSSLEELNLSLNELSELPAEVFSGLSSLEELNLIYNDLEELPRSIFDGLDNLKKLYLRVNPGVLFWYPGRGGELEDHSGIRFTDRHGDTPETATTLPYGALPSGYGASISGRIYPVTDVDYFELEVTDSNKGYVGIVLTQNASTSGVHIAFPTLFDSEGNCVGRLCKYPDEMSSSYKLEPGTYYLRVNNRYEKDFLDNFPDALEANASYSVRWYADSSYQDFLDRCSAIETDFDDPLYGCQSEFHDRGSDAEGINVEPVWAEGNLGEGIIVRIVDIGVDYEHEDLRDNFSMALSSAAYENVKIFSPNQYHGTAVAGILAASDNSVGGRGVAPRATIYSYSLGGHFGWSDVTKGVTHQLRDTAVSNHSHILHSRQEYPALVGSYGWEQAIEKGITQGFHGKGTSYVFGAGNGEVNANLSEVANFYGIINVCGIAYDGSPIHSYGSNVWICAPVNVLTTNNFDRYYRTWGGTSFATPVVSGVVALVRSENSSLTWRDVKLILAASARQTSPDAPEWETGALQFGSTDRRYTYHPRFAFGVVDAKAAVDLAKTWTNLPSMKTSSAESVGRLTIPDPAQGAEPDTVSRSLTLGPEIGFTEFVEVSVGFTHPSFRDLELEIVSPSGTVSMLTEHDAAVSDDEFLYLYRFGSAKHLGEDPTGTWTLRLTDHVPGHEGRIWRWNLKVYGHGAGTVQTALPTIIGTAQVGETLTADTSGIADEDGLTNPAFTYQWVRNDGGADANIQGATGATYTLVSDDEGKTLKVIVSFTDDANNEESLTSEPTGPVTSDPGPLTVFKVVDTSTNPDTVLGTLEDGGALTLEDPASGSYGLRVDTDSNDDIDKVELDLTGAKTRNKEEGVFPYSLYGDEGEGNLTGENLPAGAYELKATAYDDDGDALGTLKVSFTVTAGQPAQQPAVVPNTSATGVPTISGTVQVGQTLTADTSGIDDADGLTSPAFSYQWVANDEDIAGATGSSYTLTEDDEGKAITVRVSFTDDANNEESLTSEPTGPVTSDPGPLTVFKVVDTSTNPDTVLGTLEDGGALTLEDPASGSYGLRVDTDSNDDIDKVELDLTGAKTRNKEEGVFPYSLYGDEGEGNLTGENLPAGAYELKATAYDDDGDALGTLKVSFTVTAGQPAQQPAVVPNTSATGVPTISGTVQVGQTLTADTSGIDDADGLTSPAFSYQWVANDEDIAGATGSSYTLTEDDEGKAITVRVSFTDDANNEESLTSDPTGEVFPDPGPLTVFTVVDTSSDTDTVLGTLEDGGALTLEDPASQIYGIRVDTDSGHDDHGDIHKVELDLTGAKTEGKEEWVPPYSLYGDEGEGNLTGENLPAGAYELKATAYDDDGDVLGTLKVSFTVTAGQPAQQPTVVPNTSATGVPTISGTVQVGQTLTADTSGIDDADGLTSPAFSYQWVANDEDIAGATGSSYTLTEDDEGKAITVTVSFTDDANNEESLTSDPTGEVEAKPNNSATGQPTISGTVRVGETLTADVTGIDDENGLTTVSYSYQWMADDTNIQGATGSSYTLTEDDEGKAITVTVSFTDAEGNPETLTSDPTGEVAAAPAQNIQATGVPTISGTLQVGETLTADTTGIANADGLTTVSYSYQWMADDTNIQGATDATYTLAEDDEGKAIKVLVSFTDDAGNVESRPSAPTDAVAAPPAQNSSATGAPSISGTAQVGQTLTADTSGIADEDGLTNAVFSYQWVADDEDIAGATGSSYTLTEDDKDKAITVTVSFTDAEGNPETLTSAPTGEVEAKPNTSATGVPTIDGTAQVGQTLTADTSGIDDEDGLNQVVFSYQWIRNDGNADEDIAGATGSSYTLTGDDEGKTIRVTVSFTDDAEGNPETLTSDPTAEVESQSGPLTGFTVVDAADTDQAVLWKHQTDGSKPEEGDTWKEWTDGGTLALGDPESGRYGIRAEIESDTGIHRVALELTLESTGEKKVDRTDDAAPYSLYGDEGEDALHGENLPVGSYTLKATAYTEDGEILGSLEISFTVALAKPGKPQDLEGEASAQRIELAWKAPSGSVVTHYVVYRGTLQNGSMNAQALSKYATIDAAGKAMTYTDDNVEEGVEYRYRVAAVNSAGEGKKSTWLDITAE